MVYNRHFIYPNINVQSCNLLPSGWRSRIRNHNNALRDWRPGGRTGLRDFLAFFVLAASKNPLNKKTYDTILYNCPKKYNCVQSVLLGYVSIFDSGTRTFLL